MTPNTPTFLESDTAAALPLDLPPEWERFNENTFLNDLLGLTVTTTVGRHHDKKRWLHVSVSHRNRPPSWDDMRLVKELFVGTNRVALLPSTEEARTHPHVLHMWSCLDAEAATSQHKRASRVGATILGLEDGHAPARGRTSQADAG